MLHAAPSDDTSNSAVATENSSDLQNRSVEDLVAIAKAGQANEAINDAVLNNDAINGAVLGNDAINQSAANDEATVSAETSTQPPVRPMVKPSLSAKTT